MWANTTGGSTGFQTVVNVSIFNKGPQQARLTCFAAVVLPNETPPINNLTMAAPFNVQPGIDPDSTLARLHWLRANTAAQARRLQIRVHAPPQCIV